MTAQLYVIKQFDIVSVAKFFAVFGVIWGFVMGLFMAVGFGAMRTMMGYSSPFGMFGGIAAILIMIVIGAVVWFIAGAILAIVYNVVAGASGGVEMELDTKEKSS